MLQLFDTACLVAFLVAYILCWLESSVKLTWFLFTTCTWSLDVCPRSLNDTSSSIFDGRYVANWIAAVSEENKMKETRGFYRKMLLSAGIYKTAEEADLECKVPDWPRLPIYSKFLSLPAPASSHLLSISSAATP